jgi:hypothetical protein
MNSEITLGMFIGISFVIATYTIADMIKPYYELPKSNWECETINVQHPIGQPDECIRYVRKK